MKEKYKVLDLFCGAGGLSKGFEMAGFETVLAVDMWKDAIYTYNKNLGQKAICMDVKLLDDEYLEKIGTITGIIGGPPCQGYSQAGKRDINDPRNYLYLEYCRIVEKIMPEFFVIENVKGILTLNDGSFVKDILKRFGNLGYEVNFKLLTASDYGVPQKRERIFFIGTKKSGFQFPNKTKDAVSFKEAISDLIDCGNNEAICEYINPPANEYQSLMRETSELLYNHNITKISDTIKQERINMLKCGQDVRTLPGIYRISYGCDMMRSLPDVPCRVIMTKMAHIHYEKNRYLTARECARIQSFPDDFIFYGSRSSQYKQIGNAVPPLLAYNVAKQVMKYIQSNKI